jgi:hypothetical protein
VNGKFNSFEETILGKEQEFLTKEFTSLLPQISKDYDFTRQLDSIYASSTSPRV